MERTSFFCFVAHLFCRKTMGFIQIGGNDAPQAPIFCLLSRNSPDFFTEQRSNAGPEAPKKPWRCPKNCEDEKRKGKGKGKARFVRPPKRLVGSSVGSSGRLATVSEWFLCFWWIPESWVEAKSWKIWWLCKERVSDDWFDMYWWTDSDSGEPLDMEDSGRYRT